MKRMFMMVMVLCAGAQTLLHAGYDLQPYSSESVKALEGMIRSVEPPRSWPPNKWYVKGIPAFVASNGIPENVYIAIFEKVAEERIAKYADPANKANRGDFGVGVAVCLNTMGDIGEKGLLPWLEKNSDESEWPDVRTRAAVNYVKIAGLDATPFVEKILSGSEEKYDFYCKAGVAKEFFDQIAQSEVAKATQGKIDAAYAMLIEQVVKEQNESIAWELDKRLSLHLSEYKASHQRNVVLSHFLKSPNEIARANFRKKQEELLKTPKAERTDLSKRFPGLAEVKLEDEKQTEAPSPAEDK